MNLVFSSNVYKMTIRDSVLLFSARTEMICGENHPLKTLDMNVFFCVCDFRYSQTSDT